MPVMFQIQGLDAAIKHSNRLAKEVKQDVQEELNEFADAVSALAKRLAPADEGHLRGAIAPIRGNGNLEASIVCAVVYAAFMEFGTRKYAAKYVATLPQDWKTYALTFKGKGGGSMDEFIQAIMAWVRRKGISGDRTKSGNVSNSRSSLDKQQSAAYAIALNILQNGVKPQPFLYPAVIAEVPKLTERLKKILNK